MISSVVDTVVSFVTAHWDWLVSGVVGWLSHSVLWTKITTWLSGLGSSSTTPPAAKK